MSSACLFPSAVLLKEHSRFNPLVGISCWVAAVWLHLSGTRSPGFRLMWGSMCTPREKPLMPPIKVPWGLSGATSEYLHWPVTQTYELWMNPAPSSRALKRELVASFSPLRAPSTEHMNEHPLSNPLYVPLSLLSPRHWGCLLQTRKKSTMPIRKSLWDVEL